MTKWKWTFASLAICSLILAACGSNETSETTASGETTSQNEQKKSDSSEANEENDLERKQEQTLEVVVDGNKVEQTATLQNSDNQGYSMFVLPEYELSAEEPYKDILFVKDHDDVFMRIELLEDTPDFVQEEESMKSYLKAISKEMIQPEEEYLVLENSVAYQASNEEETVTTVLIKDPVNPLKLTMFTKQGYDHKQAFMEMAKTIQRNQ
ncbi:hypothetical protein [Peribacillus alkalitolerans]|uniref:hypothetical protein n=1 Tax=Peribacillus alkalitolerans TaxID=1550385 RepID=UPI0013D1CEFE|nr:hypothetical protein [Peribacillus alkalitolerans]